jgi:phytoene desaturase
MPARVKGPTDHVVVVGAGLAGLSAALRLQVRVEK